MTAALLMAAAVLAAPAPVDVRTRLRRLVAAAEPAAPTALSGRRVAVLVATAAAAAAVGGRLALAVTVTGVAAALAVRARRGRQRQLDPDLPLVADLLASCLLAGAPLPQALAAAAAASDGPTTSACTTVSDRLLAGALPEQAWGEWLAHPDLAAVARPCVRAVHSGAATAGEIQRAAARIRSRRRADVAGRVHRTGTWVVLPLGLCFLPAFVLVGVVPIAIGIAQHWR